MEIKPAKDRVICKLPSAQQREEEKSAGGIYLPHKAKERPQVLQVLWSGSEEYPVGTTIIVPLYVGLELELFDGEYLVFKTEDIHAIVEG